MSSPIVVGVDGSRTARRAAEAAARLARVRGGGLHVVTAYDNDTTEVIEVGADSYTISDSAQALRIAEGIAGELAAAEGVSSTSAAVRGKPHEVLIREAERVGAETIVVGNRGMKGLQRLLGSVANSVAHNAPCDVYIVKTD